MLTTNTNFQTGKDAREFIRNHPDGGRHVLQELASMIQTLPESERGMVWIQIAEQLRTGGSSSNQLQMPAATSNNGLSQLSTPQTAATTTTTDLGPNFSGMYKTADGMLVSKPVPGAVPLYSSDNVMRDVYTSMTPADWDLHHAITAEALKPQYAPYSSNPTHHVRSAVAANNIALEQLSQPGYRNPVFTVGTLKSIARHMQAGEVEAPRGLEWLKHAPTAEDYKKNPTAVQEWYVKAVQLKGDPGEFKG